jgi:TetR/AcrR family hemagglutinin/protease transcriptional regulator
MPDMKPAASRRAVPRPRARRLLPEARQVQLLECAVRVFARRGIAAARHAEVAEAAGVAVSTVFVYFPTRDDLVAAVLDSVERLYVELAERVHAARRPAPELLLGHAAAFAECVDAHPHHARIWLDWSSAVGVDGIWPRYRRMENRVVRVIAKTLARGQREGSFSSDVAAEDGARIAIGAAYMIAQMRLSRRPQADVARFGEALVRVLTGGLAAGAS